MRSLKAKGPVTKPEKAKSPVSPKKATKPVKNVGLKPRASEKAYGLSELRNTYIFEVEAGANKFDVAAAVAFQYGVKVTGVRLVATPGKNVRAYRQKGRRSLSGRRQDVRKAYVTLDQADKLPFFMAAEEPSPNKEKK